MQPVPVSVSVLQPVQRTRTRTALVASPDRNFRQRLTEVLTGLRWQVREAETGAEAWTLAESAAPEAIIIDSWLPDLDIGEFLTDFRGRFPQTDLVSSSGAAADGVRGPYRQELLYALRRCQDTDAAAWITAPEIDAPSSNTMQAKTSASWPMQNQAFPSGAGGAQVLGPVSKLSAPVPIQLPVRIDAAIPLLQDHPAIERLPELIGDAA